MNIFQFLFGASLVVGSAIGFEPWVTTFTDEIGGLYAAVRSFLVAHIPSHQWHASAGGVADSKSAITLAIFKDFEANRLKGDLVACEADIGLLRHAAIPSPVAVAGGAK